jgi:hypothetical protein
MKYFLSALCLLIVLPGLSQRDCRSFDYRQQQLKADPSLAATVAAIEDFTARQLNGRSTAVTGYGAGNTGSTGNAGGTGGANSLSSNALPLITIPVVVHIVYNTAAENISDAQVESQIGVLNADYQKLNADTNQIPAYYRSLAANCGFRFGLAMEDTNGQATTGIVRTHTNAGSFSINDNMKFTAMGGDDAWDRDRYLNIWVCNLTGGVLGYSSMVGGPKATDGVVVLYTAFGTGGTATAPFNKGRTATHEIGHWLNMIHVWGDDSCGNDQVADTPPQQAATYGDPSGIILSCGNTPYGNLYMDYMDFTDDIGMHLFTYGQRDRMRALFAPGGFRYPLLSSDVPVESAARTDSATAETTTAGGPGLALYPNPVVGVVSVKLSDASGIGGMLDVYNQLGQKVMTMRVTGLVFQMDVSTLGKGIYFVRVSDGKSGKTVKMIKI